MYATTSTPKKNNYEKKNRKALGIAFTLRSSMYATMCIRELLKAHSEEAALGLRIKDE
jgi:tRNA(Glu) U13 pseudouridine synthase TruD